MIKKQKNQWGIIDGNHDVHTCKSFFQVVTGL